MYTKNPEFTKPDGNPKLWRFMSFTKFVNMLHSNTLYFCRSDLLGDPFEGTSTKATIEERKKILEELLPGLELDQLRKEQEKNEHLLFYQLWTKLNFVSCWHKNEYEPYSMWKTYAPNEGIAIQSSWERLIDSVSKSKEEICIGMIEYLDYKKDDNSGNLFKKLLTKRKNFIHESELRAIVTHSPTNYIIQDSNNPPTNIINWEAVPQGIKIPVKLDDLIEKIIIAPKSPSWFRSTVESICGKYGIQKPIENSELDKNP